MLTTVSDDLSDVAIDTDISLRGMQDAAAEETPWRKSVREDLYPGDTE